jgi:hypothetical protein
VADDSDSASPARTCGEAASVPADSVEHHVIASSFADPADVARFKRCKARGFSDQHCFKYGDNGVGCWGDSTGPGSGMSCALPPEDMEERWGCTEAARLKPVRVACNGRETVLLLKDRMPRKAWRTNGASIDLNYDACVFFGLTPPIMEPAVWQWQA